MNVSENMLDAKHQNQTAESLSLVELKGISTRLLPPASTLRMLVLSEPDILPRDKLIAKLEVFLRLLYEELAGDYTTRK